jgi:hypothetical protein
MLFSPLERSVQLDEDMVQSAFGDFFSMAEEDLFPEEIA